ncbi:MAG: CRISPR-associated protein [Bacteroidetes bacterium]|nr:MAG: CRISPR-associated protein [Bacteroidota bacterium]
MLINLSNHPSEKWQQSQKELAKAKYGLVQDLSFPEVPPIASTEEVGKLAKELFKKITNIFDQCANEHMPNAVHIQGEFTLVYALVTMLKTSGISCIASTSSRNVSNDGDKKIIIFDFVQFREY